jgi:hypothetical protein
MNTKQDFTVTFAVDQSPAAAYEAINNPRGWWSEEIEGLTDQAGAIWKYHFQDIHRCMMEITEMIPGKKVVWKVLDNDFKFTKDKHEWIGNTIVFDIDQKNGKTNITFTQIGLTPAYECYEICEGAWTNYVTDSLKMLIETGQGKPNASDKPRTEHEAKLVNN